MSGSAAMIAVAAAQGAVQSSVSRLPMPLPSNHLLSSPGPGLTNIQTNTTTTASESGGIPEPEPGRFHFVAIDPIAIFYLGKDSCVEVVATHCQLEGYEVYLVEQWACSRSHPTFTIATFTGHPAHKIFAGVLSILADETEWGEELTNYFRFIRQYGRQKETPFGSLTVTNLNNFPSDLTVIAVPEGDVLQHREHFIVNEDLKRMGCGGRSALTLTVPTDASQAKFHGLFRLSDRIPFHSAVIELVKLSQQALVMFKNLGKHFADGLLCDETVKAIQRWWIEFGTDFYNIEPSDGILGPTTVSGLLGMVIGARNRLSSCGAPVPKDAFDLPQLKVAIGYFQKQHKLPRTRRLDRDTIHKLHQITAKIASAERYGMVHKAIKSTVAEMSGKNQKVEMETCDIEKFIENLSGERAKYLWYGKPRKSTISTSAGVASSVDGSTGRRNSAPMSGPSSRVGTGMSGRGLTVITGPYSSKNEEPDATGDSSMSHPQSFPMSAPVSNTGHYSQESKDHLRKAMFKTMTGRMNDAKSGLGKIKDVATGLSGQVVKRHTRTKTYDLSYPEGSSAKSAADVDDGANGSIPNSAPSPGLDALKTTSLSLPNVNAATSTLATPEPPGSELHSNTQIPIFIQDDGSKIFSESPTTSIPKNPFLSASGNLNAPKSDYKEGVSPRSEYVDVEQLFRDNLKKQKKISDDDAADGIPGTMNTSMNNSVNAFEDARERLDGLPTADSSSGPFKAGAAAGSYLSVLNRSQSFSRVIERNYVTRNEEHWPRRMSFGEAEEAILIWNNIIPDEDVDNVMDAKISPRALRYSVLDTEQTVGEWTSRQVESVENLCMALNTSLGDIFNMYRNDVETYQQINEATNEIIPRESAILATAIKEVELLGAKLQYELDALSAKVDEVEEGVAGFGRQVEELEKRVAILEPQRGENMGWIEWVRSYWSPSSTMAKKDA